MAQIYKNGTRMVRDNFSEMELYSGSVNAPESHYLSDNVLDWLPTSSSRSGANYDCKFLPHDGTGYRLLMVR